MGHAHALQEGNFHTKNIIQFAKDVDKATNGQLKIQMHAAGSLIKHPEIKKSVRQGIAPIGEILASLASNDSPVYGVDSVPFLTGGYADAKKLYSAQKPAPRKAARHRRPDPALFGAVAAAGPLRQEGDQVGRRPHGSQVPHLQCGDQPDRRSW